MITTRRAKRDQVVRPGTSTCARSIIVGITIRGRTRIFEQRRVLCGGACLRRRVISGATKLVRVERRTCTLARDN
jgi:hypothetical protein